MAAQKETPRRLAGRAGAEHLEKLPAYHTPAGDRLALLREIQVLVRGMATRVDRMLAAAGRAVLP